MNNRIDIRVSKELKAKMKAFIAKRAVGAVVGIDNFSDLIRMAVDRFIKDAPKDSAK